MDLISQFAETLSYEPDEFQLQAFAAVDRGENIIVSAPTGSGKTLVAEYSVFNFLNKGGRIFYTTPIKALSNQKYRDLVAAYGAERVGIVTGDTSVNGDAPVVVMTTEVLRNMIYAGNGLQDLACVVLDEVHFLQDRFRGAVWEEVIIHLPEEVILVALSATVSNSEQLQGWFESIRGTTRLVVSKIRPVALTNRYLVKEARSGKLHLINISKGAKPNPKGYVFDKRYGQRSGPSRNRHTGSSKRYSPPNFVDVVTRLRSQDLLPAIYFLFSRQGCDDAAQLLLRSGINLVDEHERDQIAKIIETHLNSLGDTEKVALNYDGFVETLQRGIGSHHAGLVPQFKEVVELCFTRGLLKIIFATETLALGINMPARTVVIDKLTKYNGETHEFLTTSQYSQLTGRAGRRGIDTSGTAVVLWSPYVDFSQVAELAMSGDYPLNSSFRPNYNMAANLINSYDEKVAVELLSKSFAQFQTVDAIAKGSSRTRKLERRAAKLQQVKDDGRKLDRSEQLRLKRISKELSKSEAKNDAVLEELPNQFDSVLSILEQRGHTAGWSLTSSGKALLSIFHESDLLIVEALEAGLFSGLDEASFAALLSVFCYEERRRDFTGTTWFPSETVRSRFAEIEHQAKRLAQLEKKADLEPTRSVDPGFISAAYGWAVGGDLADVLEVDEFPVGDFCRVVKKIADLAQQIGKLTEDKQLASTALGAKAAIDRGLVNLASQSS